MQPEFDLFSVNNNLNKPEMEKILESEPYLLDLNFRKSVILLSSECNGFVRFLLNKLL